MSQKEIEVAINNAEVSLNMEGLFVSKQTKILCKKLLSNKITMEEYKERSLVIGKSVTVITPQKHYAALVKDVTEKGHLIVEYEENGQIQQTELLSGEVSLKL